MSGRNNSKKLDCKVYVGDLGYGAAKQELEDIFVQYGQVNSVWVARNPPGFAFVEFKDPRDANDACNDLDGTKMNGRRVRVELSSGKTRWGNRGPPARRPYRGGGGGGGSWGGGYSGGARRGRSRSPPPKRRAKSSSNSKSRSPSPDRWSQRDRRERKDSGGRGKSPE